MSVLAALGTGQIVVASISGLIVVVIGAAAKAGPRLLGKSQAKKRDVDSFSEFFFDTPANPRTKVPGKKGWTTQVNETLVDLSTVTAKTATDVGHVRREIQSMGGKIMDNVDLSAKAAANEVIEQIAERERVRKRDADKDTGPRV